MCVLGNPISEGPYKQHNHPVWSVAAEAAFAVHICLKGSFSHYEAYLSILFIYFIYLFIYF